mgnify:CR=1 FL=1
MTESEEFEFRLRLEQEQSATAKPKAAKPQPDMGRDLAGGILRGAGSIGATILSPVDWAARKLNDGKPVNIGGYDIVGQDRRAAMDAALATAGLDTNSLAFGAGKIGAEVAGTLGVGGAAANLLGRAPLIASKAAPYLDAVRSAGMTAGGVTGKTGMALRVAGGGTTGAAAAGLVNPDDTGTGGVIGAALPPVFAGIGRAGSAVGSVFRPRQSKAGDALARALEIAPQDLAATAQALRNAPELVPGSVPTVAQVLQSPQAGILERVVSDSAGGVRVKEALAAQNAARMAALEGVAPTAPTGYAAAREDLGAAVGRFANKEMASAKAATRAAYEAVPQDEAALYLPDLGSVRDKYFGAGSFTSREAADKAVRTAQQIGTEQAPGIVPVVGGGGQPKTLAQAVRSAGGLNLARNDGRGAELVGLRGELKNLVFNRSGMTPARMAQKMHEAGYLADDSADTLIQALKTDSRGGPQYSINDLPERQWAAARAAEMGAPPAAEAIPKKVTLREFDNLRKSIGQVQRAAAVDPARASEAAALSEMKRTLDDRLNQVVAGDGKIDEVLPIAWADALDKARALKLQEVQRFMTGPQASIFRQGADGQPLVQGGEVAAKFWGNRPGLAEDVKSFRRLVDDNPALLGQFRSLVTTEGASTATAGGNLSSKFVRWFDNMRPGIAQAFSPQELQSLERIAADIKRAEGAAAAGSARGSNTYQNASNALQLGLLDSPIAKMAASRIPYAGGAVDWLRDTARTAKARQLAEVLSDPQQAANALMAIQGGPRANALMNQDLQALLLRSAPVAVPAGSSR